MRLHPFVSLALSIVALPFLLAAAAAQRTSAPPAPPPAAASGPSFHKPARPVVFTVTVRDKHGKLVQNLTPADFTLSEDGHPETIQSFSTQSSLPLLLGLEFDTSRTLLGAMSDERKAATAFLATMLPTASASSIPPTSRAFLIHFDNEVELLEDFTSSRDRLDRELSQMGPTPRGRNPTQDTESSGSNSGYGGRGSGNSGDNNGPQRGERDSYGGTQLYDAIYLASDELMKSKPGRKALIVFSDGVDRNSKETQSDAIDAAEHAATSVYTVYFRGGERRQSPFSGMGRNGGMGGGWPGSGGGGSYPGSGYPGTGSGYPGSGGNRQQKAPIDGKKVMQDIAARTGGQFFEAKKSENLTEIYSQIADLLRGQYVLVYTPSRPDNDGGYHKVVLKPKKNDLIVTMREGYYAPGGDSN